MSAVEVTDAIIESIENRSHELIVVNFANGDMVGHTGNFEAAVKAVETLDACIARVEEAVLAATVRPDNSRSWQLRTNARSRYGTAPYTAHHGTGAIVLHRKARTRVQRGARSTGRYRAHHP